MNHEKIAHNLVIGKKVVDLAYTNFLDEARCFASRGFEPVECSFGSNDSVLGKYELDHHGRVSSKPPVSVTAAQLASEGNVIRKFLTTGSPDPDSVYAILALCGAVRPDMSLAQAIGHLDIDPFGVDRTREPYIRTIAFEERLGSPRNSLEGFIRALEAGAKVFTDKPLSDQDSIKAKMYERDRIRRAEREVSQVYGDFGFVVSDDILRDVHFQRAPVIVQYKPGQQRITVRGLTKPVARRLGLRSVEDVLGKGGLDNVYPILNEMFDGQSGGRKDIGGSPREVDVSLNEASAFFERVGSGRLSTI